MAEQKEPRLDLIDIHSHILPGMDDGAESEEESFAMLRLSYRQGVRHMWATPHFYPQREDPAAFLTRRAEAAERLRSGYDRETMPLVSLGAEVAWFYGLGRCTAARELAVTGTPYILVEMPAIEWSPDIVEDLLMVHVVLGLKPIIAHVERCIPLQKKKTVRKLSEEGVYFQSNAGFVGDTENKRREIRGMLKDGFIDVIASDCHGIEHRKPNLAPGLRALGDLASPEEIDSLRANARALCRSAVPLFV